MFLKQKEMGFPNEDKDKGKTRFKLKDNLEMVIKTGRAVIIEADGETKVTEEKVEVKGKKAVNLVRKSCIMKLKPACIKCASGTSIS